MKGYAVGFGYMGYVPLYDKYILFSTERKYEEYMEDGRWLVCQ